MRTTLKRIIRGRDWDISIPAKDKSEQLYGDAKESSV